VPYQATQEAFPGSVSAHKALAARVESIGMKVDSGVCHGCLVAESGSDRKCRANKRAACCEAALKLVGR